MLTCSKYVPARFASSSSYIVNKTATCVRYSFKMPSTLIVRSILIDGQDCSTAYRERADIGRQDRPFAALLRRFVHHARAEHVVLHTASTFYFQSHDSNGTSRDLAAYRVGRQSFHWVHRPGKRLRFGPRVVHVPVLAVALYPRIAQHQCTHILLTTHNIMT